MSCLILGEGTDNLFKGKIADSEMVAHDLLLSNSFGFTVSKLVKK